jgi:hypothetical protein
VKCLSRHSQLCGMQVINNEANGVEVIKPGRVSKKEARRRLRKAKQLQQRNDGTEDDAKPRNQRPTKGQKHLASYRPAEPRFTLPAPLQQEAVLGLGSCAHRGFPLDTVGGYDPMRLYTLVAELSKLIKEEVLQLGVEESLDSYWLTPERIKSHPSHHIHTILRNCPRFCNVYETLVREVVGPHLLGHVNIALNAQGQPSQTRVLYQFPPTLR